MKSLFCLALAALACLTGCSHVDWSDIHDTSVEGRWLGVVLEDDLIKPKVTDLSKIRVGGVPISFGINPFSIRSDKTLGMVLQNRNGTAYQPTALILGPIPGGEFVRAEFACDGALAPAVVQEGYGYVAGNWRLARGRRVRATATANTEVPNDCTVLVPAYDLGQRILFVADGDVDRVYALKKDVQVWIDDGAGTIIDLRGGEYMEVDALAGTLKRGPTRYSTLFDSCYGAASRAATEFGL